MKDYDCNFIFSWSYFLLVLISKLEGYDNYMHTDWALYRRYSLITMEYVLSTLYVKII